MALMENKLYPRQTNNILFEPFKIKKILLALIDS